MIDGRALVLLIRMMSGRAGDPCPSEGLFTPVTGRCPKSPGPKLSAGLGIQGRSQGGSCPGSSGLAEPLGRANPPGHPSGMRGGLWLVRAPVLCPRMVQAAGAGGQGAESGGMEGGAAQMGKAPGLSQVPPGSQRPPPRPSPRGCPEPSWDQGHVSPACRSQRRPAKEGSAPEQGGGTQRPQEGGPEPRSPGSQPLPQPTSLAEQE